MTRFAIMPDEMLECWSYDPATGQITWKKPRGKKSHTQVGAPVPVIEKTSDKNSRKYQVVHFAGHEYFVQRVAWFLMTGEQPPTYVDHVNNEDTLNNRFNNLRLATPSQNQANAKGKGNRNLPKGVCLTKWGTFRATIMVDRKQIALGSYPNADLAAQAYALAAVRYFGEFARAA